MAVITLATVAFRDQIPLLFLGGDSAASVDTARLAATLLAIGATFFVTDALQGIAGGALRGLNDTRVPMLFAAVSFWLIGFPAAYGLAFWAGFDAADFVIVEECVVHRAAVVRARRVGGVVRAGDPNERCRAGAEHHEGVRRLTPLLVWQSDDRHFLN